MRVALLVVATTMLAAVTMALPGQAAAADLKIGYIDMARALNEVEEGKAAKAKLTAEFEAKQKELDKLQEQLKAKQEEFEKKKGMMKEDVKQAKMEELQRDFVSLQQTFARLQRELMEQESKLTQEIGGKLRKIVDKIGDRDGYAMILNIGDTVLYYKRHLDITDDVVRAYNQQYGSGSSTASKKK